MAGEIRGLIWPSTLALFAVLMLGARAGAQSPTLSLTYHLYRLGVPVMMLGFEVSENDHAYRITSTIRSTGLADLFSRYRLRSLSDGVVTADGLHPEHYESDSSSRIRHRRAQLDFTVDGNVSVVLEPPEEPGTVRPTPRATLVAGQLETPT